MGNNMNEDRINRNNTAYSSNNSSNAGINLSNLFDLSKLGNILGLGSGTQNINRGNGQMRNPLSAITNMLGGNQNNRKRQSRCNMRVLPIEEAYRKIKTGDCFLLDVRTEMEYNTIRIKGSVNIPLDRLQREVSQMVTNKEECIIVYCATGSRVRRAMQILWSLGYLNVCIWEGAGINTFAFQDLIVYNEMPRVQNNDTNNNSNIGGIY